MKTEDIIRLCKQGDEHAMSMLYNLHAARLERICRRYVNDPNNSQDLVHDVFIVIFSSIGNLHDEQKFDQWSAVIAKNVALQFIRRRKHQPEVNDLENPHLYHEPSSENTMDYSDLLSLVERLPHGYKQVFKLSIFEGMTHKEIGELLGIEPHSSSSQLHRAKKMLQDMVRRYGMWTVLIVAVIVPIPMGDNVQKFTKLPHAGNNTTHPVAQDAIAKNINDHVVNDSIVKYDKGQVAAAPHADSIYTDVDTLPWADGSTIQDKDSDSPSHKVPSPSCRQQLLAMTDAKPAEKQKRNPGLSVSVTSGKEKNSWMKDAFQDAIDSDAATPVQEVHYRYHAPITLSVTFNMQLSHRLGVETGLRYTRQQTEVTVSGPAPSHKTLDRHLIGIPVKGTFSVWSNRHFRTYTHLGATMDIPVAGESEIKWSLNGGLGVQYNLSPSIGIYAEPGCEYRLNQPCPDMPDKRFDFTLPIGLRFTW